VNKKGSGIKKSQLVLIQQDCGTDSNIAKYLGVSTQYIFQLRKKYGMGMVKNSQANIERDKKLYRDFERKMSRGEIAEKYKLNYFTVCRIIKKQSKERGDDGSDGRPIISEEDDTLSC